MTISNEGVLTWDVPRNYEGKEATVIVQVSDNSHQETFHSFKLSIADQPRAVNTTEGVQPKEPPPEN